MIHPRGLLDRQLSLLPESILFELERALLDLHCVQRLDVCLKSGAVVPQGGQLRVSSDLQKTPELLCVLRE